MNAYSRPLDIALPSLSPQWVRLWMEKTQDLVLLLDSTDQIAGVFQSEAFTTVDVYHWIGQALAAVVSPDSRPKLTALLDNDASVETSDARWRHINLLGLNGHVFPVLARCMRLPGEGPVRAIFCRDLRPMQEANDRFLAAQRELEHQHQLVQARLQAQDRVPFSVQGFNTAGLLQTIKHSTYAQVMRETVNDLERQCLQALLDEAGGDPAKAAAMAGLELSEWLEKMTLLQGQ